MGRLIPVIEAHELVGLQIVADLQAELGADYKVAFFSDHLGRRVFPKDSE